MTKFREIQIGDTFDFTGGQYPSFYDRCRKTGTRSYVSIEENGSRLGTMRVGSVNAEVYNVERA